MYLRILALLVALVPASALAQNSGQNANEQVVHRELASRLFEEMNKAISCQVNLEATKAELDALKKAPAEDKK